MNKLRILITDDDEFICKDIATSLDPARFEIDQAFNRDSAFEMFQKKRHHIVVTDLNMKISEDDGFVLLQKVLSIAPRTAVMILTGFRDVQKAVRAMQLGALDYVTKPCDANQIAIKVNKLADRVNLTVENERLKNELSTHFKIIGSSLEIKELKAKIPKVAESDCRVLITGPNGTGKELVAQAIRSNSDRFDKPFVTLNCAAVTETLIESELFGTVKGAFNNAVDKKGKFELAHEGTLFLDEIGDMSLATQAKVLRAIDTGEISRVGSEKTIRVDVRILAATNKDLLTMIREKSFREDLYFRLNVFEISTVSLAQHKEDIPLLIEHKLRKLDKPFTLGQLFSAESVEFLKSRAWPGNVRELNNIIERLCIFWEGEPLPLEKVKLVASGSPATRGMIVDTAKPLKEASDDFEREYIRKVIDECKNNMTLAAQRLDVPRTHLYEILKRLGIERICN